MIFSDELRLLRRRVDDLKEEVAKLNRDEGIGCRVRVMQLVNGGSFPSTNTNLKVYKVQFHTVTAATDAENATATTSADPGYGYAVHLGTGVPSAGTYVLGHHDGNRWIFQF